MSRCICERLISVFVHVTVLFYGNAIFGKEVSCLWYHDLLVYLHFLIFSPFFLGSRVGHSAGWLGEEAGVGLGAGAGLGSGLVEMAGHGWRSKRFGGWGRGELGVSSREWGARMGQGAVTGAVMGTRVGVGVGAGVGVKAGAGAEAGVVRH